MQMLPKTHSTTDTEGSEYCSFFFATCDEVHLTCFDELSREKKIAMLCFGAKWAIYFVIYFFFMTKKTKTQISNLGFLFIFSVFVFET